MKSVLDGMGEAPFMKFWTHEIDFGPHLFNFGPPPEGRGGMGEAPSGLMGKLHLGIKSQAKPSQSS